MTIRYHQDRTGIACLEQIVGNCCKSGVFSSSISFFFIEPQSRPRIDLFRRVCRSNQKRRQRMPSTAPIVPEMKRCGWRRSNGGRLRRLQWVSGTPFEQVTLACSGVGFELNMLICPHRAPLPAFTMGLRRCRGSSAEAMDDIIAEDLLS